MQIKDRAHEAKSAVQGALGMHEEEEGKHERGSRGPSTMGAAEMEGEEKEEKSTWQKMKDTVKEALTSEPRTTDVPRPEAGMGSSGGRPVQDIATVVPGEVCVLVSFHSLYGGFFRTVSHRYLFTIGMARAGHRHSGAG